jgi:membrane protease YdiL (CAAX protease family)
VTTEVERRPGFFRSRLSQERAELAAFLALIVPGLVLSFLVQGEQDSISFAVAAVAIMVRDLALVALILYFLRRNGESLAAIGWRARSVSHEIALGLVLAVPTFIVEILLNLALAGLGVSSPSAPPSELTPSGPPELVLGAVLVTVVAFSEETTFRGYLLLRFRDVGARLPLAILLSSFIFTLGHGYEGPAGLIVVAVLGLVLACVYVWRDSLVAPVVMHFVLDFVPIVIVPLRAAHS